MAAGRFFSGFLEAESALRRHRERSLSWLAARVRHPPVMTVNRAVASHAH
jgi:hypothetical protein